MTTLERVPHIFIGLRIILTAAPPQIPARLIEQLARGGRLVAPVGGSTEQELILLEKLADGTTRTTQAGAVIFVPMRPLPPA